MRKDRKIAIALREKGFSYNEISKKLEVPKSTLSYWLSDLKISDEARRRLSVRVYKGSVAGLIRRNKNQTVLAKKRADGIRSVAKKEVQNLLNEI